MKTLPFLIPFFLVACADKPATHPPLVKVRAFDEARTALKTTAPKSLTADFDSIEDLVSRYNPSLAGARQLILEAQG